MSSLLLTVAYVDATLLQASLFTWFSQVAFFFSLAVKGQENISFKILQIICLTYSMCISVADENREQVSSSWSKQIQ